jgi:DNA primase
VNYLTALKVLKAQLERKGKIQYFQSIKVGNDNVQTNCPYHKGGQEKKASFGILLINKGKTIAGTCHCFTCGKTVSFEELVSNLFGVEDGGLYGISWLRDNVEFTREFEPLPSIEEEMEKKFVSEDELKRYRVFHTYMQERGLTKEIIGKYDIGFDEHFMINGRLIPSITIPVKDEEGNCLFIIRRSVRGKFYHMPSQVSKPIYGIYELEMNTGRIAICESVFNALTLVKNGIQAVALLGTGTRSQIEKISSLPFREILIATDGDDAGRNSAIKLKKALKGKKMCSVFPIPEGKDINSLTEKEINVLLKEI